jgi:phosphoribosylglycinamide formyltransferase-1
LSAVDAGFDLRSDGRSKHVRLAGSAASRGYFEAEYDDGPVIAQCRIPILNDDTPATLQARVLGHEHEFLVETLDQIVAGSIRLP